MEQEDLVYLSDQAQEAYMAFQRRFESDDWKSLIDWAKEQSTATSIRQLSAQKWDDVLIARGMRMAWNEIIDLEVTVENQFLTLVAEAKEQRIVEDEEEHQ